MEPKAKSFNAEDRRKYIGGSEIAAVMGLSRWQTPLNLWAVKTGKIEGFLGNEAAELGTELEDFVARKFSKKSGLKIRRDERDFTHPKYPYMIAHIDRWILGSDAILECKTCSAWKEKEWGGEEIPVEYVLQCNWYCGILGKSSCWLAVLVGGQKFLTKEMQFDGELFEKQVDAAKTFWEEFVQKDTPPMAVANDNDTIVDIYPASSGTMIPMELLEKLADVNVAIEHRLEVIKDIAAAEAEKDAIDAKLKAIIGENDGLATDKWIVTWKNQTRTTVDSDKLKAAGLFDQYSKTSVGRAIRVTAKKEKVSK